MISFFIAGAIALTRIAPVFLLVPFFGEKIPLLVRGAVAIGFAAIEAPVVAASVGPLAAAPLPALIGVLAGEVLVGSLIGLLTRVPFAALESTGRMIDNARGANLAEVLVPGHATQSSFLGALYFQLGLTLFLVMDGHLYVLRGLALSYAALPVGGKLLLGSHVSAIFLRVTALLLESALLLALPVLLAVLLTDVVLGLLSRAVPSIDAFLSGLPLKAAVGLAVVLILLPLLPAAVKAWLVHLLGEIAQLARG